MPQSDIAYTHLAAIFNSSSSSVLRLEYNSLCRWNSWICSAAAVTWAWQGGGVAIR